MFQSGSAILDWLFLGVSISGLLILTAIFLKKSNGLFFARTLDQYKSDKNNPKYEKERYVGKNVSKYIFKYVPPLFIGFLILLILKFFNLI